MNITELTLRLMIIFIPGILTALMIDLYTFHKKWEAYKFIIYTFLSGLLSYLVMQLFYSAYALARSMINKDYSSDYSLSIWDNFSDNNQLPYWEIGIACLISLLLGFLLSAGIEKKLLNVIGDKLGITAKYGDESLFYNFFRGNEVEAVYVRDIKHHRIYHGYVDRYSEDDKTHEILLSEVDVYTTEPKDNPELLYQVPKLYICRSIEDDLNIEIPHLNPEEK